MSETNTHNRAVIALGGKQHLVSTGTHFQTNRLTNKEGESVELKDILTGQPVKVKVVSHLLGKKINGLKFKNKVRFIRHYGHRQQLSALEVVSIGQAAPKAVTAEKPAAKKVTKKNG